MEERQQKKFNSLQQKSMNDKNITEVIKAQKIRQINQVIKIKEKLGKYLTDKKVD